MVVVPFTLSPSPCSRRTNLLVKYFTHVFLCFKILFGLYIQVTPLFHRQLLYFTEYLYTCGI